MAGDARGSTGNTTSNTSVRVFISYTHGSKEYQDFVWTFANRLRREGIDAQLDQYEQSPSKGWPRWCAEQIRNADYVVVLCTEQYCRRIEEPGPSDQGRGSTWEGSIIYQELYDAGASNTKFIPAILSSADRSFIPSALRGVTCYDIGSSEGYESLYRRLTAQPDSRKPHLGEIRALDQRERRTDFSANTIRNKPHHDDDNTPNRLQDFRPREQLVRTTLQNLSRKDVYGIAILEPRSFGARSIVSRIVNSLQDPNRDDVIIVRLIPKPYCEDEPRFFTSLFTDLKCELETALKKPLSAEWLAPFHDRNDITSQLDFEETMQELLQGPVASSGRYMVVVIEGMARLQARYLEGWAYLISRLCTGSGGRLRLLAWGSQELYQLCRGVQGLGGFSPFHMLHTVHLEPYSATEIKDLVINIVNPTDLCSVAKTLTEITGGHPALVSELIERAPDAIRNGDRTRLRSWAMGSRFLQSLRSEIQADKMMLVTMRRMVHGDIERQFCEAEERLLWYGILADNPNNREWTAPVMAYWAKEWLKGHLYIE